MVINGATISGNEANYSGKNGGGGGLYVYNGEVTVNNASKISGNLAENGCGGGIYTLGGSIEISEGAQIGTDGNRAGSGNTANYGGGIYVNSGELSFVNGTIGGNNAFKQGGGVYIKEGAKLKLKRSAVITKNYVSAPDASDPEKGKGGGVYLGGTLEVGENAGDLQGTHELTAEDNYVGSEGNLSNIYLPSYNKVISLLSDISGRDVNDVLHSHIGFTAPTESFIDGIRPVISAPTGYSDWLTRLMPDSEGHWGSVFDDQASHIAVHQGTSPFNNLQIFLMGCWTTEVTSNPGEGHFTQTADGVCHIWSNLGLAWFSSLVNGLNHREGDATSNPYTAPQTGLNAVLEADINMGARFWVPLGAITEYITGSSSFNEDGTGYTGTFDGQGHVIKGLECAYLTGIKKYGLFGAVNGGTVKNTLVDDFTFTLTDSGSEYCTGGIVGSLSSGTIMNCEARGLTEDINHKNYTRNGGLVGHMYSPATVHSCMAMPEFIIGTHGSHNVGGLVGVIYSGTLENSFSNPIFRNDPTGTNDLRIGGLAGYNAGTIENCYV